MDQATFAGLLGDFQQQCRADAALPDLTAVAGQVDAPVVVLIHGIGGNAQHWTDPLGLDPASTWLFDLAARPQGAQRAEEDPARPDEAARMKRASCAQLDTRRSSANQWRETRAGRGITRQWI